MTWLQVAELPHASVALYVLVSVSRFVHMVPDIWSLTNETVTVPPQLSVATTELILMAGTLLIQETVTLAGQVMTGGILSKTDIVCTQVDELPHSSVAR
jgi:hypothetical protein